MPKLDLRQTAEQKNITLADVPIGEWWLNREGRPVQRVHDDVIWYDVADNTFNYSLHKSANTPVTRKLCDSIEMIWE